MEITQYRETSQFIKNRHSVKQASQETKIPELHIRESCQGRRFSAGGYVWRYGFNDPLYHDTPN